VVYGSLLAERWRVLHAQMVHAIEELTPDRLEAQVERLAYHAFRGEVWAKVVVYCQQAGAKAAERCALRDAAVAFEQALVALQMRYTSSYSHYAVWLGEGYVLAGRVTEARQLGQQTLEAARAQKQPG